MKGVDLFKFIEGKRERISQSIKDFTIVKQRNSLSHNNTFERVCCFSDRNVYREFTSIQILYLIFATDNKLIKQHPKFYYCVESIKNRRFDYNIYVKKSNIYVKKSQEKENKIESQEKENRIESQEKEKEKEKKKNLDFYRTEITRAITHSQYEGQRSLVIIVGALLGVDYTQNSYSRLNKTICAIMIEKNKKTFERIYAIIKK